MENGSCENKNHPDDNPDQCSGKLSEQPDNTHDASTGHSSPLECRGVSNMCALGTYTNNADLGRDKQGTVRGFRGEIWGVIRYRILRYSLVWLGWGLVAVTKARVAPISDF